MSLKKALDDCLIDFDRRVLVTDLLEEYKLSYKEVSETLEEFIKKQEENNIKYEKRFLVHGMQKEEPGRELYTVVQENKLKDWLQKLRNAESKLYSVEVAGGSKSAAPVFKPMQHLEVQLKKLERRAGVTNPSAATNGVTNGVQKAAPAATNGVHKATNGVHKEEKVEKEANPSTSGSKKNHEPEPKKTSPKEATVKSKKGGINSFFSAAPPANNKSKETKATPVKTTSSGTMDSFFKKNQTATAAAPAASTSKTKPKAKESPTIKEVKKKSPANTSVQLFLAESEEESSDEEEKLDKLRRQVVGSGDEADADDKPSVSKRRRIVDSDDEEQPTKKSNENKPTTTAAPAEEQIMEVDDDEPANETYLDEDGFVITQRKPNKTKSQPANANNKKKTSPPSKPTATAAKKKSPPSAVKNGPKDTVKTKQGNIMSFFSKK
ncbi:uncharacterized protein Dwil_GK18060 [Drosophila willistoni]|uniref:DNA polymerase delta subunit 3 n=1 Tax=Drosophila willistoni TaxID=7260 RepID=B4MZF1_DROWI|nr:uncharacterized protein Dwil_GK18060 [Drosophila willistoni]